MAEKKKVEAITSRDEDFAKWYTDIVKKAELIEYTSVKGCMVIRPYGYAICDQGIRFGGAYCVAQFLRKFQSFTGIGFVTNNMATSLCTK